MLARETPTNRRVWFGGDYNPFQWSADVRLDDYALMRTAHFGLATVNVFDWALIEPKPGEYRLDDLARVLDHLHEAGVAVDLATGTASPPPWFAHRHPDHLPVDARGHTRWPGGRQAYCPSSEVWRERSLALTETLAGHFGQHPAVRLWHVGNEFGCHTSRCWCTRCEREFRRWLQDKYQDVDGLNVAWGTTFWSQYYQSFEEVLAPRITPDGAWPNPTQQLDFRRFASDQLLKAFVAERDLLHGATPGIPVTTNFMVMTRFDQLDYWRWASEVDVVSNDYYPDYADPLSHIEAALCASTVRGMARGAPWIVMETAPSAVNWQPRNARKQPGRLLRDAVQQVAHGADAFCVFQFRASRAGAEKFHSGLLPHAGADSRQWREAVELGAALDALAPVAGSAVVAEVALLWDYQAWWACNLDSHPSVDVDYPDRARAMHRALWDLGITVDVAAPSADLSRYRLVIVPTLYLVEADAAAAIATYVAGGGHVVVTYFSGIVDQSDQVYLGGYPGAFRELLGIRVEEFAPLLAGQQVEFDGTLTGTSDTWTEELVSTGAEVVATFAEGPVAGSPAITRHRFGDGVAWYIATRTDVTTTADVIARVVSDVAGIPPSLSAGQPGVEVVRRRHVDGRSFVFVLNHSEVEVSIAIAGQELMTDTPHSVSMRVPAGGVRVVEQAAGQT